MAMKEEDVWRIMANDCSYELNDQEKLQLEDWLKSNPNDRKSYELLNKLKIQGISKIPVSFKNELFVQVQDRIQKEQQKNSTLKKWLAVAASLFIVLASSLVFYLVGRNSVNSQLIEVVTPNGIKTSVHLSDGTLVVLNSNSKLQYPSAFTGENREIQLIGEGYFKVARDKQHPFLVKTKDQLIQVLGTQFNVKAYDNEHFVETTLEEGSVSITLKNNSAISQILKPGEQSLLDKRTSNIKVVPVDPIQAKSWQEDKFYFKSRSFEYIAHILERKFDVQIIIEEDHLKNTVFTGDFVRGENLDQILHIIKKSTNLNYKRIGQKIIISE